MGQFVRRNSARLIARGLRTIDRAADFLGLANYPLLCDIFIAEASRRTNLDDYGDWSFEEPLTVLLRAYQEESHLTALGRVSVRWDMLRFLSNLLRLRQEERERPAILQEEIEQPIFILGLPRSGTTFLHNLLAQDPANRVARCWQTIYPYQLPGPQSHKPDRRKRQVARQFASFLWIAPELPSLHPLEADAAQECIEITGQVFRSLRFDTTHYVPTYERWLDAAGHHEAYRFHKRFLQHLQHQSGPGRWILKSPDHTFALDALSATYPDARYVFVHRDPLAVLSSVSRLTEILRQPFTYHVDRRQIGRQVSDRWALGVRLLIEISEKLQASPDRAFHLHYGALSRDPLAAVRAIYEHFGLNLSSQAEGRVSRFVASRPKGGYGENIYRPEDYGLDLKRERRRYQDYVAYFGVGTENASQDRSARSKVEWAKETM